MNALGVLRGLLHHLAVIFALSHEVAAGHQIGAPEFSRHEKTLLGRVNDLPELKEWQQAPKPPPRGQRGRAGRLTDHPGDTTDCEIEDLLGEAFVLPELNKIVSTAIKLERQDRTNSVLVDQIKSAAGRLGVELPDGWKAEVARRLVTQWATKPDSVTAGVLRKASALFTTMRERFERQTPPAK